MRSLRSLLGRITMAACAFGLTFGIPNGAQAQTPHSKIIRLPSQTQPYSKSAIRFDTDWTRVVLDTQQLLRKFAAPYQFQSTSTLDLTAVTDATVSIPKFVPYVPQAPKAPSAEVGNVRATLTPVEFSSGVAAESRTLDGVLVGVQFELLD